MIKEFNPGVLKLWGGPPWGSREPLQRGRETKLNEHNLCRGNKQECADAFVLIFISVKFNLDPFFIRSFPDQC